MTTTTIIDVWASGALSRLDAAAFLGIGPTKFHELAKANNFPRKYQGDKPVFAKSVLIEFLAGLPETPQKPAKRK